MEVCGAGAKRGDKATGKRFALLPCSFVLIWRPRQALILRKNVFFKGIHVMILNEPGYSDELGRAHRPG